MIEKSTSSWYIKEDKTRESNWSVLPKSSWNRYCCGPFVRWGSSTVIRKTIQKEGDNPYGLIQSKTYGAPTVSGNIGSSLGDFGKTIVNNGILDLGTGVGAGIGASVDWAMGFADGGLLTGLGADMGNKLATDLGNRLTEDTNTNVDRIRYVGDPLCFGLQCNNSISFI